MAFCLGGASDSEDATIGYLLGGGIWKERNSRIFKVSFLDGVKESIFDMKT